MFVLWIAVCYLFFTALGTQNLRFAMYCIPPFCLFAATIINFSSHRLWRISVFTTLIMIAGYQFMYNVHKKPGYARGYEAAAKYVTDNKNAKSIMYCTEKDTGYFVFFIRKHDPEREIFVLRANKIFATSSMSTIVEDLISKRHEIYNVLNNYGVRYVVIEGTKARSRALGWLREEVMSEKFDLLNRNILQSSRRSVNNIPISIYEYKEYTTPKDGITLKMNIPLMHDTIEVPLRDLLGEK